MDDVDVVVHVHRIRIRSFMKSALRRIYASYANTAYYSKLHIICVPTRNGSVSENGIGRIATSITFYIVYY